MRLNGKRRKANAYAARIDVTSCPTTMMPVMIADVAMYLDIPPEVHAVT